MIILLIAFGLVAACVVIHAVGMLAGLRWLASLERDTHAPAFRAGNLTLLWLLIRIVAGLLALHLLHILVWGAFYYARGLFDTFETAMYFSAVTYTTVGYGDVTLHADWRMLGAIEAVTGVLMVGWSTGMLFAVATRLQTHFLKHTQRPAP